MFCPKCSQQQNSEEARFCSRCGFQLGVVKAALAADESQVTSPLVPAPPSSAPAPTRRQRDKTVGVFLMFIVALLVVVGTLDAPPDDEAPVIILICWWFVLTFLLNVRPLWRYFFGKDDAATRSAAPAASKPGLFRRSARSQEHALPPAHSVPVTNVGVRPPVHTAEVVRPPSVTEGTTNLLDKK
ncbi:MAG TPA: zinc ribbon domain-containing protein [Pyrinomonadaceae bacterium]|nr:zinc ribbon domain-containing protein [Pyrinomonadaceae bacterium]